MSESRSYRQILRSTSIIGGASVLNIGIGLVRTKLAALVLGPAGIGLIGLFQSLMGTASSLAGLGINTVGTRQIAEASGREDASAVAAARRALFWGTLALSLVGAVVVFAARDLLAVRVLGNEEFGAKVGWLALGVALTVGSGSQGALLNGLRRIGDIARVSVFSSVLSTLLGVAALFVWRESAVLPFVLAAPLANFFLGHLFVARLPKPQGAPTPLAALGAQWRKLIGLGASFMLAGLATNIAQLAIRTLVKGSLGTEPLGEFQASWAISMTYIGLVLSAMGTDYYPRLTAAIHEPETANRMVNEQTEVALLLASPLFLAMIGLAPWVIELLYSSRFQEAATVLRWQVLGDVLKIASWPLGFVILAAGSGRLYMLTEMIAQGSFVALVWLGLPLLRLEITGVALVATYLIYLLLVYLLARRRTGFKWTRAVRNQFALIVAAACAVTGIASRHPLAGGVVGVSLAIAFGVLGLRRMALLSDVASSPRVRAILARIPYFRSKGGLES